VKRREFITLLGGAAAAWPMVAHAQQGERNRRVAVLMNYLVNHPEAQARVAAFRARMREAGWIEGRNIQIDFHWGAGGTDHMQAAVATLIGLSPDVIVCSGTDATKATQLATSSIPIVFANVADPVGEGIVTSLARPGGITTGFTNYEYAIGGKWLEVLQETVPKLSTIAVIADLNSSPFPRKLIQYLEPAAQKRGLKLRVIDVRDSRALISAFTQARRQAQAALVLGDPLTITHRDEVTKLAASNRLPVMYPFLPFMDSGGLMAYGPDPVVLFRRAAEYVDKILKGARPADLPIEQPTQFRLVVNLKTAKALGLTIPESILLRADEVIR